MNFNEQFTNSRVVNVKRHLDSIGKRVTSIIEFGCGVGNNIYFLRKHFPNIQITGLDVSKESLAMAEKRYLYDPHIKFQPIDRKVVPGAVDLVFMNCVLQFIDEDEFPEIFEYLKNILKFNGTLAIYESNPLNLFTNLRTKMSEYSKNAALVNPYDLVDKLTRTGFHFPDLNFIFFYPKFLSVLAPTEKFLSRLPLGAQYSIYATRK